MVDGPAEVLVVGAGIVGLATARELGQTGCGHRSRAGEDRRRRVGGSALAPAVARIVAGAVLGEEADPALAVADAARFAEDRLVPEPAIV